MGAKKVVRHRIVDVAAAALAIAVVTVLRSWFAPAGDEAVSNAGVPLAVPLQCLQGHFPAASAAAWGVMLFIMSLNAGRYGVKYSLYPAYTLMAIPVFGLTAAAVMVSRDYLVTAAAAMCALLAVKYLQRCIMRSGRYSDLSLSMLWFGMLPLLFAPAAVVYAALPLLVLVVRPSWRDWIVAAVSLALPLFAVCYIKWCCGGEFASPAEAVYGAFLAPSGFGFFRTLNPAGILLIGVLTVMALCSMSLIISDKYSLKVKARAVMRFGALLLFVFAGMFFVPSCTATAFTLAAVPASMLVPLIFVRMGVGFTETLYRLALLLAIANTLLLCL